MWVRLVGFPICLWSESLFKKIGDRLGGYLEDDDDSKFRTHIKWVRICVRFSRNKFSANWKFKVEDLTFTVLVWVKSTVWVETSDMKIEEVCQD